MAPRPPYRACHYVIRLRTHAPNFVESAAHAVPASPHTAALRIASVRSEEHQSEPQSLMRISYAVFCLKKKNTQQSNITCLILYLKHQNNNTQHHTSLINSYSNTRRL